MVLTITRYLDVSPATATARLATATAAAQAPADAEIHIDGIDRLATLRVVVPWSTEGREATALAADRFATALTDELVAA